MFRDHAWTVDVGSGFILHVLLVSVVALTACDHSDWACREWMSPEGSGALLQFRVSAATHGPPKAGVVDSVFELQLADTESCETLVDEKSLLLATVGSVLGDYSTAELNTSEGVMRMTEDAHKKIEMRWPGTVQEVQVREIVSPAR